MVGLAGDRAQLAAGASTAHRRARARRRRVRPTGRGPAPGRGAAARSGGHGRYAPTIMSVDPRPRRHRPHPRRGRRQRARAAARARAADRVPRRRRPRGRRRTSTPTPIGDGHSNVTFALSTGVVLRRPPRGPLPPSAHDVLREARLLRALEPTPVRAPRVLAVCDDPSGDRRAVLRDGAGRGRGDHRRRCPPPLDNPAERARIADELIDALVELHAVDWTAVGLEGFGKPTGYLERQLRRFTGLWEHNRTREIARGRAGRRRGCGPTCPSRRRRRSSTATTGSATRCFAAERSGAAESRSSTGRWRRSATRSPTSAT